MANLPNKFVKICQNIIWANFLCLACLVLQNIINQNLQTPSLYKIHFESAHETLWRYRYPEDSTSTTEQYIFG